MNEHLKILKDFREAGGSKESVADLAEALANDDLELAKSIVGSLEAEPAPVAEEPKEVLIPWSEDLQAQKKWAKKSWSDVKNDPTVPENIKRQKLNEAWDSWDVQREETMRIARGGVPKDQVAKAIKEAQAVAAKADEEARVARMRYRNAANQKEQAEAGKALRAALDKQWAAIEKQQRLRI